MTAYKRYGAYIGVMLMFMLLGIQSAHQQVIINDLTIDYNHQRSISEVWEVRVKQLRADRDKLSARIEDGMEYCVDKVEGK